MRDDVRERCSDGEDRAIIEHARDESATTGFREFDFEAVLRPGTRLFDEMVVNYVFLEPDGQYTIWESELTPKISSGNGTGSDRRRWIGRRGSSVTTSRCSRPYPSAPVGEPAR